MAVFGRSGGAVKQQVCVPADYHSLVRQMTRYVVAIDDGGPDGLAAIERAADIVARRGREHLVTLAIVSHGYFAEPTLTAALAMAGHVPLPCQRLRNAPPAPHDRDTITYCDFLRRLKSSQVEVVCAPGGQRRMLRIARRARSKPFVLAV